MATLELSLPYVLANEGGYTSLPMPTNYGIEPVDVAIHRRVPIAQITAQVIQSLSMDEVTAIYREQFWNALGLDNVRDQNVATCVFDTGVNRGVRIGALYAQQTCNHAGATLVLDGILGPLSAAAINSMQRQVFIPYYERLEWAGYQAILANHPSDEAYRIGWQSRAKKLLTLI